ncbi:MAG: acylneuraminate cytidylyltransferase family protein [Verrucomicrobiales bacterium]|nr:acylneuraminate cytidylyltransferase family protein [Verrucomicrobiales bacterium]
MVAVVPARGGSKGLPGKNLRIFSGYPLIAWTIRTALECDLFERVVVSTDCDSIARISRQYGAEVPFIRSDELSGDTTGTVPVVMDVADRMSLNEEQSICLLQPTSPLRDREDISGAAELFAREFVDSVVAVTRFKLGPKWLLQEDPGGFIDIGEYSEGDTRRQDSQDCFFPNGSIYMSRISNLRTSGKFLNGRVAPHFMPAWKSIDIDTIEDFDMAQFALARFAPNRLQRMSGK